MSEQKNAPEKRRLSSFLGTLAFVGAGAAIGLIGGIAAGNLSDGNDALAFLYIGLLILGLVLAFFTQIIFHEGGHMLCGLLTGYRFVSFNVFGFVWVRGTDGCIRLKRCQVAGAGGQCLMAPPDYSDSFPCMLYNLGGVLANLLIAGLFALLFFLVPVPALQLLFVGQVLVGLYFAIVNGIPMTTPAIQNDGKNLLCIHRSVQARRALWIQLAVNARLAGGDRLKDMPPEWFSLPPDADLSDALISAIAVLNANRLMDLHDYPAALDVIRSMTAPEVKLLGLYRMALTCDGAVCELLSGAPGPLAAALDSKENQQLMRAMPQNITILRTQYAAALLRDRDEAAAEALLIRFRKACGQHPHPQEADSEREIIADIRAAHGSGGNP
ncbi:MAG: hypothetical protein IKK57_12500 [Clostridia bacterium]|nr:hypothetical protein [Clostridia bacterium]